MILCVGSHDPESDWPVSRRVEASRPSHGTITLGEFEPVKLHGGHVFFGSPGTIRKVPRQFNSRGPQRWGCRASTWKTRKISVSRKGPCKDLESSQLEGGLESRMVVVCLPLWATQSAHPIVFPGARTLTPGGERQSFGRPKEYNGTPQLTARQRVAMHASHVVRAYGRPPLTLLIVVRLVASLEATSPFSPSLPIVKRRKEKC